MNSEDAERARRNEMKRNIASQQLNHQDDDNAAEVLHQLSVIDDLPIDRDDPIMGQLISKLTSTTKLTKDQIQSNEWIRQYLVLLYLCKHPPEDGVHRETAVWAKDDLNAWVEPMDPERRMELEAFVASSNLALHRSEDGFAVKEGSRNISESVVHDDAQSKKKGLLGRFRS